MATEKPKILLILDDDLLRRVEDYRFDHRINSRAEAIRQLLEEGLKASDPSTSKSKKK